jgi:hypothetical protein
MPTQILGARKYFELNYQGNTVFVGTQKETKLEIPQTDFIAKVMEFNKISDLEQRCMVQVNLKKDISDIKSSGKNASGDMFVETTYLDGEGHLGSESAEMAEKIFLLGEQEGIMNLFINYTDGTSESLKTFCSNNTFLVEQL